MSQISFKTLLAWTLLNVKTSHKDLKKIRSVTNRNFQPTKDTDLIQALYKTVFKPVIVKIKNETSIDNNVCPLSEIEQYISNNKTEIVEQCYKTSIDILKSETLVPEKSSQIKEEQEALIEQLISVIKTLKTAEKPETQDVSEILTASLNLSFLSFIQTMRHPQEETEIISFNPGTNPKAVLTITDSTINEIILKATTASLDKMFSNDFAKYLAKNFNKLKLTESFSSSNCLNIIFDKIITKDKFHEFLNIFKKELLIIATETAKSTTLFEQENLLDQNRFLLHNLFIDIIHNNNKQLLELSNFFFLSITTQEFHTLIKCENKHPILLFIQSVCYLQNSITISLTKNSIIPFILETWNEFVKINAKSILPISIQLSKKCKEQKKETSFSSNAHWLSLFIIQQLFQNLRLNKSFDISDAQSIFSDNYLRIFLFSNQTAETTEESFNALSIKRFNELVSSYIQEIEPKTGIVKTLRDGNNDFFDAFFSPEIFILIKPLVKDFITFAQNKHCLLDRTDLSALHEFYIKFERIAFNQIATFVLEMSSTFDTDMESQIIDLNGFPYTFIIRDILLESFYRAFYKYFNNDLSKLNNLDLNNTTDLISIILLVIEAKELNNFASDLISNITILANSRLSIINQGLSNENIIFQLSSSALKTIIIERKSVFLIDFGKIFLAKLFDKHEEIYDEEISLINKTTELKLPLFAVLQSATSTEAVRSLIYTFNSNAILTRAFHSFISKNTPEYCALLSLTKSLIKANPSLIKLYTNNALFYFFLTVLFRDVCINLGDNELSKIMFENKDADSQIKALLLEGPEEFVNHLETMSCFLNDEDDKFAQLISEFFKPNTKQSEKESILAIVRGLYATKENRLLMSCFMKGLQQETLSSIEQTGSKQKKAVKIRAKQNKTTLALNANTDQKNTQPAETTPTVESRVEPKIETTAPQEVEVITKEVSKPEIQDPYQDVIAKATADFELELPVLSAMLGPALTDQVKSAMLISKIETAKKFFDEGIKEEKQRQKEKDPHTNIDKNYMEEESVGDSISNPMEGINSSSIGCQAFYEDNNLEDEDIFEDNALTATYANLNHDTQQESDQAVIHPILCSPAFLKWLNKKTLPAVESNILARLHQIKYQANFGDNRQILPPSESAPAVYELRFLSHQARVYYTLIDSKIYIINASSKQKQSETIDLLPKSLKVLIKSIAKQ